MVREKYFKKVYYVMGRELVRPVVLVLLFVVVSFLDVLGIGLIAPFILLISKPELLHKSQLWLKFNHLFHITSAQGSLVVIGSAILAAFYFKGIYGYFVQRKLFGFCYAKRRELIMRLMRGYQTLPYTFYTMCNSATLINVVTNGADNFALLSLVPMLQITSATLVVIAILVLLSYVNFVATAGVILLLGSVLLLYDKIIKKRMYACGKTICRSQAETIKEVSHLIKGLKEIRLLKKEVFFHNLIDKYARDFSNATISANVTMVIPRYLIEASLATFIVLLAFVSMALGKEGGSVLVTLGVFGAAAIRIIPLANHSGTCISQIRESTDYVDVLYDELRYIDAHGVDKKSLGVPFGDFGFLSLQNVSYKYPSGNAYALQNISLTIKKNQMVGIVGRSGAGKTTLVDVLLGLLSLDVGSIKVNGVTLTDNNVDLWQEKTAYVPQNVFLLDGTIAQNIALGVQSEDIDCELLDKVVEIAQLKEFVASLPHGMDSMVGENGVRLSGGQRQRIGIARAFYFKREVIVLDEATSALDSHTEKEFAESVASLSGLKTLIIIAHRYTTLKDCDVIYRLDQGRLVSHGKYEEILPEVVV